MYKKLLFTLTALAFLLPLLAAQDDPFDPGAFDSTVTTSTDNQAKSGPEWLLGGTAVLNSTINTTSDFDNYLGTGTASSKVFGKVSVPDYGSLYLSYGLGTSIFATGYDPQGYSSRASSTPFGDFKFTPLEFHYSFDISKVVFVRAGKQLISWGPSQIWTPSDFINSQKRDSFASVDTREGKLSLRVHVPFSGNGSDAPSSNLFLFSDFSNLTSVNTSFYDNVNYAARYDITIWNTEFGISGYYGVLQQGRGAFDLSGSLFDVTLYGEVAYYIPYSDYDSRVLATLGFSRTLDELKNWTLSGEFFYNSDGKDTTDEKNPRVLLTYSQNFLYTGQFYGYLNLEAKKLGHEDLTTSANGLVNFSDYSFQVSLQEKFSFPNLPYFLVKCTYSGGGDNKEFTRFGGNNALSLSLQAIVNF